MVRRDHYCATVYFDHHHHLSSSSSASSSFKLLTCKPCMNNVTLIILHLLIPFKAQIITDNHLDPAPFLLKFFFIKCHFIFFLSFIPSFHIIFLTHFLWLKHQKANRLMKAPKRLDDPIYMFRLFNNRTIKSAVRVLNIGQAGDTREARIRTICYIFL